MRRFTMYRRDAKATAATHNEDTINPPDQIQFEGVMFSDGTVCVRWRTMFRSHSVWNSLQDMLAVHGHPEYGSELVWMDPPMHREVMQKDDRPEKPYTIDDWARDQSRKDEIRRDLDRVRS